MNKSFIKQLKENQTSISTSTVSEKLAIGVILNQAGEDIGGCSFDPLKTIYTFPYVRWSGGTWGGEKASAITKETITFAEFLAGVFSVKQPIKIKLNSEYTAEYIEGNDFVQVGCQKIPVSAIKELASKLSQKSI